MTKAQKISLGVLVALPTVCCLGGILIGFLSLGGSERDLEKELAKARAQSMPVVPADLERTVAANENAAPIYLQAAKLAEEKKLRLSEIVDPRSASPERIAASNAVYDAAKTEILPLVEQATALPYCDFEYDYNEGFYLRLPEMASGRGFARLLSEKARRQSVAGDWRGALATVDQIVTIGRHLGQHSLLIAMLVETSVESIALNRLESILGQHRSNPAALAAVRLTVANLGDYPSFRSAIAGEVVLSRAGIRSLGKVSMKELTGEVDADSDDRGPDGIERAVLGNPRIQNALDRKLVEAYNFLWERLPDDPSDWQQAQEAAKALEEHVESDRSLVALLNKILLPVLSQAAESTGRLEVGRRLVDTSARLFEERRRTGSFPASLPDWGDATTDPFSGGALIYRVEGQGFILYSVGQDRVDDGGITSGTGTTGRDIVADFR